MNYYLTCEVFLKLWIVEDFGDRSPDKSTNNGVAMKMELNVPARSPITSANANPLILAPPKNNKEILTRNTVNTVIKVRLMV